MHAGAVVAPRRSPARSTSAKSSSSTRCACDRVWEAPRVTKPYTEEQWRDDSRRWVSASIAQLAAGDVRLTMGGEPTFVALDDPDGAEWNTAALGPTKRVLAATLYRRLKEKYAPNGLAHFGQGKWYPGEPLPRWSLNCFWRRDGEPLWSDPALIADESRDKGATDADGASASSKASRVGSAVAAVRVRRLRGRLLLPVARAAPARRTSTRSTRGSTMRWNARASRV